MLETPPAPATALRYDPLLLGPDPYPVYRRLRDEAPLYAGECDAGDFWALARFEDVQAAARDWRTFSSAYGNDLDGTGLLFGPAPAMDLADPPVHTAHRNALKAEFAPAALRARFAAPVRRAVRELIAGLVERDEVDFAREIAYELPTSIVWTWIGLDPADHAELRRLHAAMLERVHGQAALPASASAARDRIWEHLRAEAEARRTRPRDDLLTALVRAQLAGDLSQDEVLANGLFLFDAGVVSTNALISNALLHLRRFEDQRQLLRNRPEWIPAAIEEVLRFDAPFHWFTRVTTGAVEIAGGRIPAGARVVLLWASANRDERRWDDPDRLDIRRPSKRHLSFSEGIHHCLGAPLARMNVRILFEELMPVLVDYELGAPVRRVTPSERTIVSLPARVEWARPAWSRR